MEENNPDKGIGSEPKVDQKVDHIQQEKQPEPKAAKEEKQEPKEKKPLIPALKDFYASNYKKLLIIPIALLLLAIAQIAVQTATTGDFINRDVSLKGGLTVTILTDKEINPLILKDALSSDFPANDISVRLLKSAAKTTGITVSADIENERSDELLLSIEKNLNIELTPDIYSIEIMGSTLGASFFRETFKALYIAFLFMGMVVFLYFGTGWKYKALSVLLSIIAAFSMLSGKSIITDIIAYTIGIALIIIYLINSIPSIAVILAAFSDIVITLAIVNIIGLKISTAGIAAFLMLIGYSVDTDILLSTRVLKRKEGTTVDKIFGALKTGLTMSLTTLTAVTVALTFAESDTIAQIMTIILVGLIIDLISTWLQNAGILTLYLNKKKN